MASQRKGVHARAAQNLLAEVFAHGVIEALSANEVKSVLLKGPAHAHWLYPQSAERTYGDLDLLVDQGRVAASEVPLRSLGFRKAEQSEYADLWFRATDSRIVDLHWTLPETTADPSVVWRLLNAHTERLPIAGGEAVVLDACARAVHVVLHAAHHGPRNSRSLGDLKRALVAVPDGLWADAAVLAEELGGGDAFVAGLRLDPAGSDVVERLGLAGSTTHNLALRSQTPPPVTMALDRLNRTRGTSAKLTLLWRELFPNPAFMRMMHPRARESRVALAGAYLWRPIWIVGRLGPAVRAHLRARTSRRI